MNPSPEEEFVPRNAVLISTFVVVNIIWWMVMIAGIGLGATHLHRCPVQPNIPVFLMVMGAASLLCLSLTYTRSDRREGTVSILSLSFTTLMYLFSFCWFIAGTTWVYSVYPPSYTPGEALYCHKTTFQFAFAVTTLTWIFLTLILVIGCCLAVLTCCKTVRARRHLIPNRNTLYGSIRDSAEYTVGDV
ncbi:transmembrane protein 272-like [Paralichthys olivaceus]|uniref:transmembrane protein 272-like n=1 Tax=Paralichthys olivaceus TaxID=8255 RepID=UPI003751C36A